MRRIELRKLTVIRLTDAAPAPADWSYAFPAADTDDPARLTWAPDGRFHTAFSVHALVSEGAVTLVDAGIGSAESAYFNGLRGRLDREMHDAGLTPDRVTCVMLTHFHLDHVGWASRDGAPCFPNARYCAPAAELAHWRDAGRQAALPHHVAAYEAHVAPLLASGLMEAVEDGQPAPGAARPAYHSVQGHTPGHAAVTACDGELVIAGDAWHSPAQVERPEWRHRADRDPGHASRSAMELSRFAAGKRSVVAAGHFPEAVGFGHIVEDRGGFRWRPMD